MRVYFGYATKINLGILILLTLGSFYGCGGGTGSEAGKIVQVDLEYPPTFGDLSQKLLAEGTLFKTASMAEGDRVSGPVKGTSKNTANTNFEFAFSNAGDGKYFLKILFKDPSSTSSSLSQAGKTVAKTTVQEECGDAWVLIDQQMNPQFCENQGIPDLNLCKQTFMEECIKNWPQQEPSPSDTQPVGATSGEAPENPQPPSNEPAYQESKAPILGSLTAEVSFDPGKNAHVLFQPAHFNLSYDDNGDGITNLSEAIGVPVENSEGEETIVQEEPQGETNTTPATEESSQAILVPSVAEMWTQRDSGTDIQLQDVAYGNNIFIAISNEGIAFASSDGTQWEQRSISRYLYAVTYGNNIFVAVGIGRISTSSDGINWTSRFSGGATPFFKDVTYGDNLFVAVGWDGVVFTSSDGLTWTPRNSRTTRNLNKIAFGQGTFITVGEGGKIITSSDGLTWTSRDSGVTNDFSSVVYANGTFLAVGSTTTIISSDGVSWSAVATNQSPPSYMVFALNVFVGVGYQGRVLVSSDGRTWSSRDSGTIQSLYGIAYGNNTFAAVGANGTILTSP